METVVCGSDQFSLCPCRFGVWLITHTLLPHGCFNQTNYTKSMEQLYNYPCLLVGTIFTFVCNKLMWENAAQMQIVSLNWWQYAGRMWSHANRAQPPNLHFCTKCGSTAQMQIVSLNWWQYAGRVWSHANSAQSPNLDLASKLKTNTAHWNNSLHICGTWYCPSDPYTSSVCACF